MGQETNAALRRKLRTQRAAYEELLGLAGAIMAALCVRRGDGGTLRLPKQDVHDALRAMNSRRRPRARTTCSRTGSAGHDGP